MYIPDYLNNGTLTSIESIPGIIPLCDNNCSVQRQFNLNGSLQNYSITIPVNPPKNLTFLANISLSNKTIVQQYVTIN